jgi:hypothetical protein
MANWLDSLPKDALAVLAVLLFLAPFLVGTLRSRDAARRVKISFALDDSTIAAHRLREVHKCKIRNDSEEVVRGIVARLTTTLTETGQSTTVIQGSSWPLMPEQVVTLDLKVDLPLGPLGLKATVNRYEAWYVDEKNRTWSRDGQGALSRSTAPEW